MRDNRGSIALENAQILKHEARAAEQYVLRLQAPRTAAKARPGTFVHIQCTDEIALRRPLSIMRADPDGWIEVLYKPVGPGLAALTKQPPGAALSVLGPIGNGFSIAPNTRHVLALGGGVGIPPMVFCAQQMRERSDCEITVFMGSEIPFPFELKPAVSEIAGVAASERYEVELLQRWGIRSALASRAQLQGSFDGYVTDLAQLTLDAMNPAQRSATQIIACGPEPMLAASAALAQRYDVSCQLALEEFMACGVGGCAGCTVEVHLPEGNAMKRVCVDGPVFAANEIYPA